MTERDRQYLADIVEFAERALRIAGDRSLDAFEADETARYGVRYCIMVLGESAYRLSDAAKAEVSGVPWASMAAMRHRLVHGYAAVSDQILYDTLKEDLPVLLREVGAVLRRDTT